MKIAVIGKGRVGSVLGPAFNKARHDVSYGVRNPDDEKYENGDGIPLQSTPDAAQGADVVILSVDWSVALKALAQCGDLSGKILIDCNNPLKMGDNGLELALGFDNSAAEMIAARTDAFVVKALNQVGSPVMGMAHDYPNRPIQFVAGDDEDAKQVVSGLLRDIGFNPIDYGQLINARKLEPLAMVWIDQAFKHDMEPHSAWYLMPGK
ncbi:MAG: NAD(P)-binding domain-containing protein [Parasphingorhabdus sp.]|uniref:NADPH-dependent F420 reductase n=1 Tax=Parasphingorhabdus sp. TaxID=2709688 RepID=UPI0032973BEE